MKHFLVSMVPFSLLCACSQLVSMENKPTVSTAFQDEPERMEKIDVNWSSKVRRMLGLERQNDTVVQDMARRLRSFYFPPGDASVHTSEKVDRYKDLISDLYLNFQLNTVAHIQKKFAPVYLYLYNQTEGISGGAILAATDSKLIFPLGFYWALVKEYFRLRVFACFTKEGGAVHNGLEITV